MNDRMQTRAEDDPATLVAGTGAHEDPAGGAWTPEADSQYPHAQDPAEGPDPSRDPFDEGTQKVPSDDDPGPADRSRAQPRIDTDLAMTSTSTM